MTQKTFMTTVASAATRSTYRHSIGRHSIGRHSIGAAFFLALTLTGCDSGGYSSADPANQDQVDKGRVIYTENCAVCHGDSLEGESPDWKTRKADGTLPAPPHDASGHTWHHPDALLFAYVKLGGAGVLPPGTKTAMEPFAGKLSDSDIWAVLAFIKSNWPLEVQQRQASLNQE